MPYKYLEDGTEFTAKELNSRFKEEELNLNETTHTEVQWGALNAYHLPMLIGRADKPEGTQPDKRDWSSDKFTGADTAPSYFNNDTVSQVTYANPITLGHAEDDKVSALMVMFNCNIEKWVNPDGTDLDGTIRRDDLIRATFYITIDDDSGSTGIIISKSRRSVSPGYTLNGTSTWAPEFDGEASIQYKRGVAFGSDDDSFRNVAMRTIILPENLPNNNIKELRIQVKVGGYLQTPYTPYDNAGIRISKKNLTCLPIQAKVVK